MMLRILFYLVVLLIAGFGFSWLADRPGELFIIWQGQRIEMSVMVAASLVVALVAGIMFVWWVIRSLWNSPRSVSRYFRARNRDRGYQALSTGLIAAGAGDAALARKMLGRTKSLINADLEPLVHVLDAQAALIDGRHEDARKIFEALAEDPETRELGLRGLYLEALRHGAHEAARHYAERAVEKAPHLPWAVEATLDYRIQAGRFDEAIRLLETQRALVGMGRKQADRKKAVMLTGRAMSKLDADPKGAKDDGLHALRLVPELVPAALVAARGLFRENAVKKALSTLEQVFRLAPHGEIAALYVRGTGGETSAERLKRARKLENLQPESFEALYAVAAAALDARDFATARAKAEAAARIDMRESLCLLMADIEEAEHGDQGRVRHWLSQALRASRDPAWIADGQISPVWLPVSPVTGRLDAFEWRKPASAIPGLIDADGVDKAFASLPEPSATPVSEVEKLIDITPPPAVEKPVAKAEAPVAAPATEARPAQKPDRPAKTEDTGKAEVVEPFFGRPPDDPGVKTKTVEDGRFKLF